MNRLCKTTLTTLGLALGLLATNNPADAAFIHSTLGGTGGSGYDSGTVSIWFNDTTSTNDDVVNQTVHTGHYRFVRQSGTNPANSSTYGGTSTAAYADLATIFKQASGNTFWTFCIELNDTISNPIHFDPVPLTDAPEPGNGAGQMSPGQAEAVRELWARHYAKVNSPGTAAAFQLALWEIIYDADGQWSATGGNLMGTDYDYFANGNFRSNGTVGNSVEARTTATDWLRSLTGSGPKANLVALGSEGDQDQLIELQSGYGTGGGGVNPVPTPAPPTLVLALVGILPCIALRRRLTAKDA
jgi:hypothetical protein